jgi:hypothetical protein
MSFLALRGLGRQVAKHPTISFEVSDVRSGTTLLSDLPADNFWKDHLGRRFHYVQQYSPRSDHASSCPRAYCVESRMVSHHNRMTHGPRHSPARTKLWQAALPHVRGHASYGVYRDERDHFYGFGETTGELNKRGRKFRLSPKDAIGHDPACGDPLYKQVRGSPPLFAASTSHTQYIAPAFADSILCAHERAAQACSRCVLQFKVITRAARLHALSTLIWTRTPWGVVSWEGEFNVGAEISGYWPRYTSYMVEGGELTFEGPRRPTRNVEQCTLLHAAPMSCRCRCRCRLAPSLLPDHDSNIRGHRSLPDERTGTTRCCSTVRAFSTIPAAGFSASPCSQQGPHACRYAWLTGRPPMLPRYALGYLGSTMCAKPPPKRRHSGRKRAPLSRARLPHAYAEHAQTARGVTRTAAPAHRCARPKWWSGSHALQVLRRAAKRM